MGLMSLDLALDRYGVRALLGVWCLGTHQGNSSQRRLSALLELDLEKGGNHQPEDTGGYRKS